MSKKFDARLKDRLLASERYERFPPAETLRAFGLKAGDTIADIGCGPGFFTLPAAEIVGPQGRVIAADVQSDMIAAVSDRVKEARLTNVVIVKASDAEVAIPPESCDLVWLCFMLHEVPRRSGFLHRLRGVVKPGGSLAIIEWEKVESEMGPPVDERVTPDEIIADAQAAGFAVRERRQMAPDIFAIVIAPLSHASQAPATR